MNWSKQRHRQYITTHMPLAAWILIRVFVVWVLPAVARGGCRKLAQKLSAVARRKVKGIAPGDFVFLGRKRDCNEQHAHRDAKSGAFLVYALSDNYTLRVYDGSHMPVADVRQRMQQYTDGEQLDPVQGEGRLITLQKGEFVIVHGC